MSCLFISLGRLMHLPHHTVRRQICDHMARNLDVLYLDMQIRDWIRWQGTEPSRYIAEMRQQHRWGGAMEIAIATQLYHVDVEVVDTRRKRIAEFVEHQDRVASTRLRLIWTGNHYTPVAAV